MKPWICARKLIHCFVAACVIAGTAGNVKAGQKGPEFPEFFELAKSLQETAADLDAANKKDLSKHLLKFVSRAVESHISELKLNGAISASFKGDSAEGKSLYKVDSAAEVTRGSYPRELRFRAGTSLQYKDGSIQEDVTSLLINYDYHISPETEIYGFLERFTDNFLGIDQRYEIGIGTKFDKEFGMLTSAQDRAKDLELFSLDEENHKPGYDNANELVSWLCENKDPKCDAHAIMEQIRKKKLCNRDCAEDKTIEVPKSIQAFQRFIELVEPLWQSARKSKPRLLLAGAFSVFSELQQAEIEAFEDTLPILATEKTKFTLTGDQRFRATVRPTIIYNATEDLTFDAYIYFKLPLARPYEDNGNIDYRSDIFSHATFKLKQDEEGHEKVALIFGFESHFDNAPPRLADEFVAQKAAEGKTIRPPFVAPSTHNSFSVSIKIDFL